MTTFRWYLLGLLLLFGGYVAVEYYRPKPLDWRPTFESNDKIPYGTYVLYQVLPDVLGVPARDVRAIRLPIYSQLEGEDEAAPTEDDQVYLEQEQDSAAALADTAYVAEADSLAQMEELAAEPAVPDGADSSQTVEGDYAEGLAASDYAKGSYLFVNDDFSLSQADTRALLRHVARGNDVFIAAEQFDARFADTLGFRAKPLPVRFQRPGSVTGSSSPDSVRLLLTNAGLARAAGRAFRLPASGAAYRLVPDSSLRATTLATDEQGRAVLIRIPHGLGQLYLCSVPLVFTNYYVLRPATSPFAFAALSYLPVGRPVWWDEYQKQGRQGEQSLLRVLLAHDALRRALYLGLVGMVLFGLFEAKRRQRIIPVLPPLPNTTLLFTRTVASLYRQDGNHALIAEKKIGLFLEFLRTHLHEPSLDLNELATRERLASKVGLPVAAVEQMVRRINMIRTANQVSDADLLLLNKTLNDFRNAAK
ncbi:DUF4350 domain-containing protein [Hymenobacter sp. BT635]|uniref:DUF4350 domain-containing protein n=1 Tax=Hymenobacter nitidus TaxID=2880929 RepID=A0ABS8ACW4_9BACT|nr:DUF4350 domain-containing protein [Hymenobacter nitidus]MCB2378227.1 DUF4350 domain-containing protein [Hymenobacter nitidus]